VRNIAVAAALLLLALAPPAARAHEISMAELQLRETDSGSFLWNWTAGNIGGIGELSPVWPAGCSDQAGVLRCGEDGLRGALTVDGVGRSFSAVLVKIFWRDGQSRVYTLTKSQPEVQLYGAANDRRGMAEIARAYTGLGIEHILGGIDHLLFVVAMLFLVGFNRKLVWTITAFTVAHSITLALSALGWITLRPPPVEAAIALSIVLVAGEALHTKDTFSRRWPAVVAFMFGLVHGLGFAGALREIGLPQDHLLVALLTFNVGVELGQLAVVCAAYLCWKSLSRLPNLLPARTAALYGIGSVAAYWSFQRIFAIFA
jgi:hydrogenase/urease accessory protein HupE